MALRQRQPPPVPKPLRRGHRCYVRRVLGASRGGLPICVVLIAACVLAGCGGGERQDENEPEGDFAVQVFDSKLPAPTSAGGRAPTCAITVRNAGDAAHPERRGHPRRASTSAPPPTPDAGRPRRARASRSTACRARSAGPPEREGREPARLRHRLREHLGLRPAGARRRADVPLVVDPGGGRPASASPAAWPQVSTATPGGDPPAPVRRRAASSPASSPTRRPRAAWRDDGETVVSGTR